MKMLVTVLAICMMVGCWKSGTGPEEPKPFDYVGHWEAVGGGGFSVFIRPSPDVPELSIEPVLAVDRLTFDFTEGTGTVHRGQLDIKLRRRNRWYDACMYRSRLQNYALDSVAMFEIILPDGNLSWTLRRVQ